MQIKQDALNQLQVVVSVTEWDDDANHSVAPEPVIGQSGYNSFSFRWFQKVALVKKERPDINLNAIKQTSFEQQSEWSRKDCFTAELR